MLGSIRVYERDGKYQLYANEIAADGVGFLYQQFDLLKKKLEAEGIFDRGSQKAYSGICKIHRYCDRKDRCGASGYDSCDNKKKSFYTACFVSGEGSG